MQGPHAQSVPQGGLCQQARRVMRVLDVGHRDGRIGHAVIYHSIHRHRDAVLREDLHTRESSVRSCATSREVNPPSFTTVPILTYVIKIFIHNTNKCTFNTYNYSGYRDFPGGKVRSGRDADPLPPSSAEVKSRVELYLYSP